ncbi:MAG TPA: serine/threonine-protein kinase, partial [Pirellulaceae bacterium]|nr:serine/threonine-protein kinase [Pirellulaceae bacterium]
MTKTKRYCRRCDQQFAVESAQRSCPECDTELVSWHDGQTLELDTVSFATAESVGDASEAPSALVGKRLAHYQIERFLGEGGMARVYLAKHLTLERPCAIKVLRPITIERDKDAAEAFLAEARSAAALVHPHVVALHTIGEADGRHYIEMEYVGGESLGRMLERSGVLEPLEATRLMLQVCSALAAAHTFGMVHRDIKPGNVMVTPARDAKLADFGLAKRLATNEPIAGRMLCGTPNFMAPELFTGKPATTQSDIYAMGVTYYSLLIGRLPVETQSINELVRFHHRGSEIDIHPEDCGLPVGVVRILQRALAKDYSTRHEDATVLYEELLATFGSLRPLRSLLQEAFRNTSVDIVEQAERFAICVRLPSDRQQTVQVEISEDAETGESIVRTFSICGRAADQFYERALQLNATISHGSVAIQSIDGEPHFVMVNAYPRATCDPEEIRKSV